MKRFVYCFLSVIIICPVLLFGLGSVYAASEAKGIESFVTGTVELIQKYDLVKDFEVTADMSSKKDTVTVNATEDNLLTTDAANHDFQTCRLIVKADREPEKLNCVGMVSGFLNYYIVQFKNETDTVAAYEYYKHQSNVIDVETDAVFSASCEIETGRELNIYHETPVSLDSWGAEITGLYDVKKFLIDNNVTCDETVVAVIDSGVELTHSFLRERLIETGFNASAGGAVNSENDTVFGHGTAVSSIIVDCTPNNVKVANYRILDDEKMGTITAFCAAILKAVSDDADIINASLIFDYEIETTGFLRDTLQQMHNSGAILVASAGNDAWNVNLYSLMPAASEYAITVAASNSFNMPTGWTNLGVSVDVMAPGEELPAAFLNNTYEYVTGTSFSAPLTASLCAMLKGFYPEDTPEHIEAKLEGNAFASDLLGDADLFGYGIIDAVETCGIKRLSPPVADIVSGVYVGGINVALSADEGSKIYYTIDGTYPTQDNGIPYTGAIRLFDDQVYLRVATYKENHIRSRFSKNFYRTSTLGTDDMFTIDGSGKILSYIGDVNDLTVPEIINGIEVKSIGEYAFANGSMYGLTLPPSVNEIHENAFYRDLYTYSNNLMFVDGVGVEEIGKNAFYGCENLYSVDFPNVKKINAGAFCGTGSLSGISFPLCEAMGMEAFWGSGIRYANLPKVKTIGRRCFADCDCLCDVYLPQLDFFEPRLIGGVYRGDSNAFEGSALWKGLELDMVEKVWPGVFVNSEIVRLELSKTVEIASLPSRHCLYGYGSITLALPSTLTSCDHGLKDAASIEKLRYKIYGSKGTYAQQWAYDNGFDFIEISQETALLSDLPAEYYPYMKKLKADVIGFNKTYQWYGSDTESSLSGTPVAGATERLFYPSSYPAYKYYYCVVTSTDAGYDPVEICTGVCKNMSIVSEPAPIISCSSISMKCGTQQKLTVKCEGMVRWVSSDPKVAVVDQNGTVTAFGRGTAEISATAANGQSAKCTVKVYYTVWQRIYIILFWLIGLTKLI